LNNLEQIRNDFYICVIKVLIKDCGVMKWRMPGRHALLSRG